MSGAKLRQTPRICKSRFNPILKRGLRSGAVATRECFWSFHSALSACSVSRTSVAPKSSFLQSDFADLRQPAGADSPTRTGWQGQPAASCLFSCFSFGEGLRTNGLSLSVPQPKFLIAIQSYVCRGWINRRFCGERTNRICSPTYIYNIKT